MIRKHYYPGKYIGSLRLLRMVRGGRWECLCVSCGSYIEFTEAQLNTRRDCGCNGTRPVIKSDVIKEVPQKAYVSKSVKKSEEISQQEQEELDLGFQRLAYAILRYASNDYEMLKQRNVKRRWIKDCGTPALSELKEFINSDWCELLTNSISVTI